MADPLTSFLIRSLVRSCLRRCIVHLVIHSRVGQVESYSLKNSLSNTYFPFLMWTTGLSFSPASSPAFEDVFATHLEKAAKYLYVRTKQVIFSVAKQQHLHANGSSYLRLTMQPYDDALPETQEFSATPKTKMWGSEKPTRPCATTIIPACKEGKVTTLCTIG